MARHLSLLSAWALLLCTALAFPALAQEGQPVTPAETEEVATEPVREEAPAVRKIELEGDWLVDFGVSKGVLRFERGKAIAICYGADAQLGSYTVRDNYMKLILNFQDGQGDHKYVGPMLAEEGSAFRVDLAPAMPNASLVFTPYTGDCSEFQP